VSYIASRLNPVVLAAVALMLWAGPADAQRRSPQPRPAPTVRVDVAAEAAKLAGTDLEAAAAAAAQLGRTRDAAALDALLDALALGMHPRTATAALDAVAAHASVKAFDTATFFVRHRDARVRAAAVRVMGALDDSRAHGAVLAALADGDRAVRAAAAQVAATRKLTRAVVPLMALLQKGDDASAPALAALADPDVARAIGETLGTAPDGLIARALGLILARPDFGPETARVEVVRALGRVPGTDALEQLTSYLDAIPESPPRQSRREAEAIVEQRLSGDF
jgi:HEAT repeat protein